MISPNDYAKKADQVETLVRETAAKDARIAELEAERDALQSKLDERNAQVSWLVSIIDGAYKETSRPPLEKNIIKGLARSKAIADAYKAELLKPWMDGVDILFEHFKPTFKDLVELEIRFTFSDIKERIKALKATEGLN